MRRGGRSRPPTRRRKKKRILIEAGDAFFGKFSKQEKRDEKNRETIVRETG